MALNPLLVTLAEEGDGTQDSSRNKLDGSMAFVSIYAVKAGNLLTE